MALVILASGSPLSWRCRMAAARHLSLGSLMSGGMVGVYHAPVFLRALRKNLVLKYLLTL